MRHIFLTLIGITVPTLGSATLRVEPCQFGVAAELLILSPQTDDNFIALQNFENTPTRQVQRRHNLDPDYKPGVRVEGLYAFDCQNDLHLRFTYFNSTHNRRTLVGNFVQDDVFPDTLTTRLQYNKKFKYFATELLLGRWLFDNCDFDCILQYGLLYSYLKTETFRNKTVINPPAPPFTLRAQFDRVVKFWGIGPEFGIDFQYHLPWRCQWGVFSIAGDARGALLASKRRSTELNISSFVNPPPAPPVTFTREFIQDAPWRVTPAADLRLGLNWALACNCWRGALEVGYEWIYYQNAVSRTAADSSRSIHSITFQGPYISLGIGF